MLTVAIQTGLRVSELTDLTCGDAVLGVGAHLRCFGKGRKERLHTADQNRMRRYSSDGFTNSDPGRATHGSPVEPEEPCLLTLSRTCSRNT